MGMDHCQQEIMLRQAVLNTKVIMISNNFSLHPLAYMPLLRYSFCFKIFFVIILYYLTKFKIAI